MQQINANSTEKWIFDFSGEEYTFEMASGTDPARNVAAHRLTGVFPGKQGAAFLSMMMNDDDWDEESVLQIIESMGGKLLRKETIGVTETETISEGSEGTEAPEGTAPVEDTPLPNDSGETSDAPTP
jgi:hypothetical protein